MKQQRANYDDVIIIVNSIGAFLALSSLDEQLIDAAFLISPIVNMEKLICDMVHRANVSEKDLAEQSKIATDFGETLSRDYLCYVRQHAIKWKVPTYILYGERDYLSPFETVCEFAAEINAPLTVMENGEHWFRTDEQMRFLDNWILDICDGRISL